MKGGSQSHLLVGTDGKHYITKFLGGPQHRRTLVNELISTRLLQHIGVLTPQCAIVQVDADLIDCAGITFQYSSGRIAASCGRHFGSEYPGDPAQQAVYDFLPSTLLRQVVNLDHLIGAFVFDTWTANSDMRQAIFLRTRLGRFIEGHGKQAVGFLVQVIDHGYTFDGPHWDFLDGGKRVPLGKSVLGSDAQLRERLALWISRVETIPEEVVQLAVKEIPDEWLEGDRHALCRLLDRLMMRRARLARFVHQHVQGKHLCNRS